MFGKLAIGIAGLDQITVGGLTLGRTTLIQSESGSGKTVMARQILVNELVYKRNVEVNAKVHELEQRLQQLQRQLDQKRSEISESKLIQDQLKSGYEVTNSLKSFC